MNNVESYMIIVLAICAIISVLILRAAINSLDKQREYCRRINSKKEELKVDQFLRVILQKHDKPEDNVQHTGIKK